MTETPAGVVDAFERVMTEVLGGRVTGKASINDFAERDPPVAAPGSTAF